MARPRKTDRCTFISQDGGKGKQCQKSKDHLLRNGAEDMCHSGGYRDEDGDLNGNPVGEPCINLGPDFSPTLDWRGEHTDSVCDTTD